MILYTYFRSSAAYRVRIALNLKGLSYQSRSIHLLKDGGEQNRADYLSINPQGLVPTLIDGEHALTQSMAIIEYLDERYPDPPLLPGSAEERCKLRALANIVACYIHPLNNLRVLRYLKKDLACAEEQRQSWYQYWIAQGMAAMETFLNVVPVREKFCFANRPSLADLCLVPQVYNAERNQCDMTPYPRIQSIYDNCMQFETFQQAAPEQQTDAE
ncbi:MAG: maleylacetoacetate isomerase [Proteobacteria bacterium]|nr:maleylacetoacetate isomerase [Pseudomonadota bacterium]